MAQSIIQALWKSYRNRALRRGIGFHLTLKEFNSLVQQPCDYCGIKPSNEFKYRGKILPYSGIDRLDSSLPYTIKNVVPCCKFCNTLKSSLKPNTWLDFLKGVVLYHQGEIPEYWIGFNDPERAKKAPNFWRR